MWKDLQSRHRPTDLNIRTNILCKTCIWFSSSQAQSNEHHTEATSEAKTPLLVGSAGWRSDGAGNPKVLEGCICPISSMSHPGRRGQNGKSSWLSIMFLYKCLWVKAPMAWAGDRLQDALKLRSASVAFWLLLPPSPLQLPPGHTSPPFSATTHRHRCGLSSGLQYWQARLRWFTRFTARTAALERLVKEALWNDSGGKTAYGDALENPCAVRDADVIPHARSGCGHNDPSWDPAVHTWPDVLMVEVTQPAYFSKNRPKKPSCGGREATEGKEGKWWEEGSMLLSDLVTFVTSFFLHFSLVTCAIQQPQPTFLPTVLKAVMLDFLITARWCGWTLMLKGFMFRRWKGSLYHLFNRSNM